MNRRRFCAIVGSSALAGVAGCLGPFAEEEPTNDDPADQEPTPPESTPTESTPTESTPSEEPRPEPVLDYEPAWAGYQFDPAHTGYAAAAGPTTESVVTWRTDTWGPTTAPVVGEERAFFGTGFWDHERLVAVDRDTGDRAWEVGVGHDIHPSIGVADGFVYVAAEDLRAFTAENGEAVWTALQNAEPDGVTVTDGVAYTASRDREEVYALDAHTGKELWTATVTGITTPTVRDDVLFVSSYRGVHALDAESGEEYWAIEPQDTVRAPLTAGEGLVYGTHREALVAYDADSGDRQWSQAGYFRGVSPALVDGTLYVSGHPGEDDQSWHPDGRSGPQALALDAATGEVEWTFAPETFIRGSPVVADGVVYVPSRNWLYAFDAESGELRWREPFEWSVSTPAVADGQVLANVGGRLTAVAGPDAEPAHDSLDALEPAPYPAAPEYRETDFYFGTGGYEVTATADATVDEGAPFDVSMDASGDFIDENNEVSFAFELHNRSDQKIGYSHGAPAPLGVITLGGVDGTGNRITAWTDAYEESGHVHDTPLRGVTMVNSIGLSTSIDPGERIEETYTLSTETHELQPGTYEFSKTVTVSTDGLGFGGDEENDGDGENDDEQSEWQFEVRMEAEIQQPAPETGETLFGLAILDSVTPPEAFVGRFDVAALAPVTDRHPGLIEISLTNESSDRDGISSQGGWPFGSYVGEAPDGSRVVLLREDMYAPTDVEGDGAAATPAYLPHRQGDTGWSSHGVDAGESLAARYLVFAHPDDAPLSSGTYTFKNGYADGDVEFTWGFLLAVF